MKFDMYAFSLPRIWAAAVIVCIVDFFLVAFLVAGWGAPLFGWLRWLPRPISGFFMLYAPFVACAIWLVLAGLAVYFHGARGAWVLLVGLLMLPVTYLHWGLIWMCVMYGSCL